MLKNHIIHCSPYAPAHDKNYHMVHINQPYFLSSWGGGSFWSSYRSRKEKAHLQESLHHWPIRCQRLSLYNTRLHFDTFITKRASIVEATVIFVLSMFLALDLDQLHVVHPYMYKYLSLTNIIYLFSNIKISENNRHKRVSYK